MRISEIEVGTEYAAIDKNSSVYYTTPRQVKVLEIVIEEQQTYSGWTTEVKTRKHRKVKVKFLDSGTNDYSAWRNPILTAKKNSTLTIEPKLLVGKWDDLKEGIKAKVEEERKIQELEDSLYARLRKLGLRDSTVHVSDVDRASIDIYRKDVEKILTLAEAGKAVQK